MKKYKLLLFIGGLVFLPFLIGAKSGDYENKPNIIFIYTDDLRYDGVGFNGNPQALTPMLDRMAKKSLRFQLSIAQYLKEAGYHTGMSGKWHIGKTPVAAGFDFSVFFRSNGTYYGRTINDEGNVLKVEKHCDLYCVERSIDFINDAAKKDEPFFLFHNTQLPHMNGELIWDARQETKDRFNVAAMPVPEAI